MAETNTYPEDEIDLKQLFNTLWLKKKLILSVTSIVTLLAALYAFNKTSTYEVKAVVEIGSYQIQESGQNYNKTVLESSKTLVKKLNILFIDLSSSSNAHNSTVSTIKSIDNFIEIKAQSTSNELATARVLQIVDYIQAQHKKILDEVKRKHELEMNNLDVRINTITHREIKLLSNKVAIQEQNLKNHQSQIAQIEQKIKTIKDSNLTLAALKLMEKRDRLSSAIVVLNLNLMDMQNQKNALATTSIEQLLTQKQHIESMLLPHNHKNSEIVGQVITSDHPIKPKKKLIIAVALVAGFIFSIFWVLIVNAFRSEESA